MSDHHHHHHLLSSSNKRLSLSLSSFSPSKKPKPSSPPPDPTSVFFSDDHILDAFSIDVEDEPELHQQLISNLLLASSSPTKTTPFPFKVRFVSYPYLPLFPFESSSSYITINGNEETCGSSFSDADSSLMASLDTCDARVCDAFGFLSVQNGDVFGSDGMMMKKKKKKMSREEEDVDVWDWGDFLEEVLEEGKIN